jgi:hypothetical protein
MIPAKPPPTLAVPSKFSTVFNHFVATCLVKDPNHRPDADLLLKVTRPSFIC